MATQRDDSMSVDVEDPEFQAFLNESLSDDEQSGTKKGPTSKVEESGETSSVWWVDDANKESLEGTQPPVGMRRSSFMKTSSLLSDDLAAKRAAESLGATASDSTIHEEEYAAPGGAPAKHVDIFVPAEITDVVEEPETSVGADNSRTESEPVLHSTLLGEITSEPAESADLVKNSDAVETVKTSSQESEQQVPVNPPVLPAISAIQQSNLLSQVQLSDTGSLDLTLQSKAPSSVNRAQPFKDIASPSVYSRPVDSSITELDEEQASEAVAAKRPQSEQSGSASAVDKKAVRQAMSTLISDQVADSADVHQDEGGSQTTNSKTMPELIAEMEALDSREEQRPPTPPTLSSDRTQSGSIHFTKSPYRPSSSQKTARVRSTGMGTDSNTKRTSPSSTLRSQSKIPLYAHVRSSGYGAPSYMPQLSRGSGLSSLSSSARLSKHFRASDQLGSTLGSQGKEQFYISGSVSGEPYFKQKISAPPFSTFQTKTAGTQTIPDLEGKKEVEHWHHLWTESCHQVNDLHKRLDESERSLQMSQGRLQQANESLARLRKSIAAKPAGDDQHGVAELERMLVTYQRDNEKMRLRVKDLEKENQRLAEAPPGELAHLMDEVEKLRLQNNELRSGLEEEMHQYETELKTLMDEVKRARSAEAESELLAAQHEEQVAKLEHEKAQFGVEIEKLRDQLSAVENAKPDAKIMSKTVSIAKQPLAAKRVPPGGKMTAEKDESAAEISRLKHALSMAESELEKLRHFQQQEAMRPASILDPQSRKLELAVRELKALLREKHPGSVPVAVLDIAAEESAANAERIRYLEDRCRLLEANQSVGLAKEKPGQVDFSGSPVNLNNNEKSYSAAIFADGSANDDRVAILRRHIAEQDGIIARLRNEGNELKSVQLSDKAEIVRLKGALAMVEKQPPSQTGRQEEIIQTLLRERAVSLKTETKLKAELFESGRRLEVCEARVRELLDQLADARSAHTPERRLFDRLLDRLAELERRFARREETIRELRAAAAFGQPLVGNISNGRLPLNVDQNFLRSELDKLVQELHELRTKAAVENLQKNVLHTSIS